MGYNEFDELGDKIQSIIDSAVNEKNYQKLSQSINQALNKAIDNGSDALRDALNNTVGSGKYTNYRSGSSYDYRENRSWDFQKDGKKSKTSKDQFLFSGYFFRQKQSDQTEDGKSSAEKGDAAINACGAKNIIG